MNFAHEGLVEIGVAAVLAVATLAGAVWRRSWALWVLGIAFWILTLAVEWSHRVVT